ncbi:hypothetical protein BDB00DRAFT_393616 [Zychaea mexicana]|uniref:uncharacterized protein n=1 Tax=Zychaea mexicana TaxID=64656 RepID=UPI0022FE4353|nr:uncharacterized protein BDB00DRAFT_393616 [Zychaea mexicana]KAI9498623.1 hypothetical protein BDB00DRAFT_393616 [Zychaea mexicana]
MTLSSVCSGHWSGERSKKSHHSSDNTLLLNEAYSDARNYTAIVEKLHVNLCSVVTREEDAKNLIVV